MIIYFFIINLFLHYCYMYRLSVHSYMYTYNIYTSVHRLYVQVKNNYYYK